jgi:hypothetical protein
MTAIATEPAAGRATSHRRLSLVRLGATGAVSAALFYVLCWIGALISPTGASHMYLRLFASAELTSGAALAEGVIWSLGFGIIAGVLVAFFYNLFEGLDRR